MSDSKKTKVFVLGVSKTGTSTFEYGLHVLGYKHLGYRTDVAARLQTEDIDYLLQLSEQYDSADDWPWPSLFKLLDKKYPDAKFILTYRKDPKKWLSSYKRHCEWGLFVHPTNYKYNRAAFGFGFPHGNGRAHLKMYHRHMEVVQKHFADRPGKLLTFCIDDNPSWKPLCEFLGCSEPEQPFPHVNKEKAIESWRRYLKRICIWAYSLSERVFFPGRKCIHYYE